MFEVTVRIATEADARVAAEVFTGIANGFAGGAAEPTRRTRAPRTAQTDSKPDAAETYAKVAAEAETATESADSVVSEPATAAEPTREQVLDAARKVAREKGATWLRARLSAHKPQPYEGMSGMPDAMLRAIADGLSDADIDGFAS